jgi:hypothetical protein
MPILTPHDKKKTVRDPFARFFFEEYISTENIAAIPIASITVSSTP